MNIIGWKIYYGDDTIFTSINGGWKEAPSINLQVVIIFYDESYQSWNTETNQFDTHPYRKFIHSFDYYWLENGIPHGGNTEETYANADAKTVKTGTLLTKEFWRSVYIKARSDLEWK